jgi:hypothetical protein
MYASLWHGIAIALLLYWPGFAMGWGNYFDMSDAENEAEVGWIDKLTADMSGVRRDYYAMSLRGLHFTVPTAAVASLVSPVAMVLAPAGLLMGAVYYLAKKYDGRRYVKVAEMAWGAILGAIMIDMGLLMSVV